MQTEDKGCILTLEEFYEHIEYWKPILRLEGWKIEVKFVDQVTIEEAQGAIRFWCNHQRARILIPTPESYAIDSEPKQDMLKTLVHELLHLKFLNLGINREGAAGVLFEQAIDTLARALVNFWEKSDGSNQSITS